VGSYESVVFEENCCDTEGNIVVIQDRYLKGIFRASGFLGNAHEIFRILS
jgi:hypothetical protein